MTTLQQRRPKVLPNTSPGDEPDWPAYWVVLLPALQMGAQLILFPLVLMGFQPSITTLLFSLILANVLTVGIAWNYLCRRLGKTPRSLGLRLPARTIELVLLPLLGAAAAILGYFLAEVLYSLFSGGRAPPPQRSVELIGAVQGAGLRVLAATAIGIVAPIAEEIVFRGVVFRALRWRWSRLPALLVSAILFSLAHLDLHHALHLLAVGIVLAC